MIITFRSKAAGDVIMFGDVAMQMMQLMGKIPDEKGIVTVEQLPAAIAGLRAAIDNDRAARASAKEPEQETEGAGTQKSTAAAEPVISVSQRAVPLLELLEWAQKKKEPVIWGS